MSSNSRKIKRQAVAVAELKKDCHASYKVIAERVKRVAKVDISAGYVGRIARDEGLERGSVSAAAGSVAVSDMDATCNSESRSIQGNSVISFGERLEHAYKAVGLPVPDDFRHARSSLDKLEKEIKELPFPLSALRPWEMVMLAASDDENIRQQLANERCLLPGLLSFLSDDSNNKVRLGVASNGSTPSDVLKKMLVDSDVDMRKALAGNSKTPSDVLTFIASQHKQTDFRELLTDNHNTPKSLLAGYASDKNLRVRRFVASNIECPPELLTRLSYDKHPKVRVAVARNFLTPKEVLLELYSDEDEKVRASDEQTAVILSSDTDIFSGW